MARMDTVTRHDTNTRHEETPVVSGGGDPQGIKFQGDDPFYRDVKARVSRYFEMTGRSRHDCPQTYVKSAIIISWLVSCYVLLVFFATTWWQAIPLAVLLGLAVAALGFNIQHDGGHRAFSRFPLVNRIMATSLDFVGGSSFIWNYKHNTLHHTYANIDEHDDDIDVGILGRFSPQQKRMSFHRVQHFYMWMLYAFLLVKWHLFDDFRDMIVGRVGTHRFTRPTGRHLVIFVGGKLAFFSLAFAIPMWFHPVWVALCFYGLVSAFVGVLLSVVFQLAHVVEAAKFPVPEHESGRMPTSWAVHQVETTVNFSRRNPILTWYLGGLNFQVEHHLFPRTCHVHYPRLSRFVERACARHGVRYNDHGSVLTGIASHFRWLKKMGQPDTVAHVDAQPA